MECGQNYIRSMASFALLLTFSGFRYDKVDNRLTFRPLEEKGGTFMCTYGEGWGRVSRVGNVTILKVEGGRIDVSALDLGMDAASVVAGGILLDETVELAEGDVLVVS